jgi:glycosyltransferase involved in cell wall biosynthesis
MRVLHLTEAAGGGVRKHLATMIPALADRGVACSLAVFSGRVEAGFAEEAARLDHSGCPVRVLDLPSRMGPGSWLRASRWFRELLRELTPAVVHAHSTWAGLLARGRLCRAMPPHRTVYSPHAFAFQAPGHLKRGVARALERLLMSRTDCYALVSRGEMEAAERVLGVSSERLCLAENGVPAKVWETRSAGGLLREKLGVSADAVLAVVPGRLCSQKGQDWLLRALHRIDMTANDLVIAFCGDGPSLDRLHAQAAQHPHPDRFLWPGFVPHLADMIADADLVVMPSRYEGQSYALLEALVLGIPLVASDIAENVPRPFVRQSAAYVPVDDDAALAAAIRDVCAHLPAWKERAGRAAITARKTFSAARQADELAAMYRRLTADLRRAN